MAADPRQFTEHNEVNGANIYYEDKRMEELKGATGKTASQISTTDEFIPLQDTDGNLVKINPASFQEAVRNVLGSLLANNDKGTTISGVPALSGNGASLDFGSITPANLASVLGVKFIDRTTGKSSADLVLSPGYHSGISITYGGNTYYGALIAYGDMINFFAQIFVAAGNIFVRRNSDQGSSTFLPWKKLTAEQ